MSSAPKVLEKEQNETLNSIRKHLSNFGTPRIIIIVFFLALLVVVHFAGMNLPSFLGDILTRWGLFGILVLAMVPGIQSGITLNFGVSIGIIGGMVGAVLAIEMNHRGVFNFVTNETLFPIAIAVAAILIGVVLATIMGILYGMLLNRVKGSEMAITVYVGWAVVSLFNVLWARFPVTAGRMVLPATGVGLRQMINLQDDYGGAFNNLFRFQIGAMNVNTGLLLVFFLFCLFVYLFQRSRTGMRMSAAGANPAYATASGINVNRMRILGTTISTVLGAVGIIVYSQGFGFLQMYNAPLMMGFTAVASVLIGGASIRRARVFDVLLGALLFNGILTVALPLTTRFIPDVPGIPEMLRLIISNGIILFALTRAKGAG